MIRYSLPLALKAASAGVVEGYASDFLAEPDLVGDVIAAGAFAKSLERHKAADTRPAMLWAHNQSEPIGRWLDVKEDDHGLYVRGKLTMTVTKAAEAYALAQDGALAFSIGFIPVRKSAKGGANLLEEVDLHEISLVGLAANPRARITSVKSLNSIRDYEQFLRECGLSHREAKRLSMGGWRAYRPDDEVLLADAIRASAQQFKGLRT